ncbi:unnamed protein product [marine sediment metagenome]|uniref:Uncharacterized protein n=1 Tax=marine sediment metagenome TaxID=412755 RepID=X0XBU3_9ZZZZ
MKPFNKRYKRTVPIKKVLTDHHKLMVRLKFKHDIKRLQNYIDTNDPILN